jgi:hypothetical protein
MTRMLEAPALHFAVIGAALFLASAYRTPARGGAATIARQTLVIDARRVEELRRDYTSSMGEAPDPVAESQLVESEINDELLYREALRLGLDRADRTVYWRLVEKMKFLGEARTDESDDQLFRRALDMGLQEKDPIIRRVLIRKVGMLVRFAGDDAPPSEAELRDYYDRHPPLYARPGRVTLVHVFFSNDARGEHARADAERVLVSLRDGAGDDGACAATTVAAASGAPAGIAAADDAAIRAGDPFLGGHVFTEKTRDGLAKLFGDDFADAVTKAPEGSWHGPIRSAFGFHLVAVRKREDAGRMPLASVRAQVAEGVEEERHNARLSAKLVELRARYDVRVEEAGRTENVGA